MKTVLVFLKSLFWYLVAGITGAIFIVPCFFIACLPARWRYDNRVYYWLIGLNYKILNWATFLPISVKGKENIPQEPAVLVANHQSSLDIPIFGALVNSHPHIWFFLARFAKIPIFGFIARRMNVVVDHSGLRKLVGSLDEALKIIKQRKSHVLLFPEGGRYIDNKIHNFFYGFAILAKEAGRPVIPVMMYNLNKVYPPGSFLIHYYPIRVIVGSPFNFKPDETEDEFVQRVHAWFVEKTAE
jgi:1-acyl-sn-glycerol-3-phosphate acyltransferase